MRNIVRWATGLEPAIPWTTIPPNALPEARHRTIARSDWLSVDGFGCSLVPGLVPAVGSEPHLPGPCSQPPWQYLNFKPLSQGHGSFLPTPLASSDDK